MPLIQYLTLQEFAVFVPNARECSMRRLSPAPSRGIPIRDHLGRFEQVLEVVPRLG
jgi:hypothetical protein